MPHRARRLIAYFWQGFGLGMNMKRLMLLICVVLVSAFAKAQVPTPNLPDTTKTPTPEWFYIDGDSVSSIELEEVMLREKLKFSSRKERIRYLILKRKTKKVWPYAKLAAERLVELDKRLASIEDVRARKRYAKMVKRYVEDEFSAELKKLTKTEGQILIKLIHRQTGESAYELISRLRSGWSAFWFNSTASFFDISLKEEYSPATVSEDFLIEDILLNQFLYERLEEQEPAIEIDYWAGKQNWLAQMQSRGRERK
jgi:hypothetical protein